MGNLLGNQQSGVADDISEMEKIATKAAKSAQDAGDAARVAAANVDSIADTVIQAAGSDPYDQRDALMRSQELAQAQHIAQHQMRKHRGLTVASQQAAATAAALTRLKGRQTSQNIYDCPEFKSCTGTGAYNTTRASGIANDYNRGFARKNGDIFTRPESITTGGENACDVSGTFLDRVSSEYNNEKRKFQYDCDADKGWYLSSVSDIEGMIGNMAY